MKSVLVRARKVLRFVTLLVLFSVLVGMTGSNAVSAQSGSNCFVSVNNSGVTDHAGADAGALRDAVNAAAAGSTLKVAGTCAGTAGNRVVYIDKDLTIVGGYDSSDWSAPPDSVANPTVLDAQQGGRVAVIAGNAQVTLRHLTLRNGLVSGDNFGGAILVNTDGFLLLEDSRIEESQASLGGAIFNEGPVEIIRSTLSNNQASAGGGAIYARADLTIRASTFANNTATSGDGGAIVQDGGAIDILNSTFSGNNANNGGAICVDSASPHRALQHLQRQRRRPAGAAIRGDSAPR